MFDRLKPGHVLTFGVCPSAIDPPAASKGANDNTLITPWPVAKRTLGVVRCLSHATGALEPVCAQVAKSFRSGDSITREASYSPVGNFARMVTGRRDVVIGQVAAEFVGYIEGKSMSLATDVPTVFSKDFSGCLMVAYELAGRRHVAHVAASSNDESMDCKQAFIDTLRRSGGELIGWFRPYEDATDGPIKERTFHAVRTHIGGNPNNLVTFGVVYGSRGYAIDAFKPTSVAGGTSWVVTRVVVKDMDPCPWSLV